MTMRMKRNISEWVTNIDGKHKYFVNVSSSAWYKIDKVF